MSVGGSPAAVLVLALVLGLRHASDPDHLVAVSTLVATEDEDGRAVRRAGSLGLSWGLGHATTLVVLGLPVVAANLMLPGWLDRAAEGLIGVVITGLALRLLARWRAGRFHSHAHSHGGVVHRHVHPH